MYSIVFFVAFLLYLPVLNLGLKSLVCTYDPATTSSAPGSDPPKQFLAYDPLTRCDTDVNLHFLRVRPRQLCSRVAFPSQPLFHHPLPACAARGPRNCARRRRWPSRVPLLPAAQVPRRVARGPAGDRRQRNALATGLVPTCAQHCKPGPVRRIMRTASAPLTDASFAGTTGEQRMATWRCGARWSAGRSDG